MGIIEKVTQQRTEKILAGLNPKQAEAVTAPFCPVDVIAGAGAGKTTVLTRRAAYFIEKGISPQNIIAITFTNKAANEMRERLTTLLGEEKASQMQIRTFHSLGNAILRSLPNVNRHFSILDDDDKKALVIDVLREINIDPKMMPPSGFCKFIEKQKCFMRTPKDVPDEESKIYTNVYEEYEKTLNEQNMMDFDDLIFKTVLELKKDKHALKALQERTKALLIDEYQDTNDSQNILATMIAAKHKNIFVVGDPDQSIYGFRFADIKILLDFTKTYPNAVEIKLEQNYRSTKNILSGSNALIKNNVGRIDKTLWTDSKKNEDVPIFYRYTGDSSEEANWVARTILEEHRQEGIPWNQFAVLYRNNSLSREVEEAFLRSNIPYIVHGGIAFLDRAEVKDVLAFLRVAANPKDLVSLKRIINVPARGIGKKTQDIILRELKNVKGGFFGDISTVVEKIPGKAKEGIMELREELMYFKEQCKGDAIPVAIGNMLENLGYIALYEDRIEESEMYAVKLDNINQIISFSTTYTDGTPSLEEFLDYIALASRETTKKEDKVNLMTCHRAKGLEFDTVFVVAMEEGFIPTTKEMTMQELEEERRIAYVAMTRAKRKLFLSSAHTRYLYGRTNQYAPSRFLDELPEDEICIL